MLDLIDCPPPDFWLARRRISIPIVPGDRSSMSGRLGIVPIAKARRRFARAGRGGGAILPRSVRSSARPADARHDPLPRSGYSVRSTNKLSVPPAVLRRAGVSVCPLLMLLRQLLVRFLDDLWIDKLFGLRALDHRPDSNLGIVDEVLSNQLRLLHVTVHDAVEQSLPRLLNKLERRLLETRTQSDALEQRTETTSTEPTHGYSLLLRQHHYWSRELLASDTAPVSGFPFSGTACVAGCG